MTKRLKPGSGIVRSPDRTFEVCVTFGDGVTHSVAGISDSTTIGQLRERISATHGRNVRELFDENAGDEEALDNSRSALESGISGSSRLVAVESGRKIVVAETLGVGCTDAQFEELSNTATAVSVESLELIKCRSLSNFLYLRNFLFLREITIRDIDPAGDHNILQQIPRYVTAACTVMEACTGLTSLDLSRNSWLGTGATVFTQALTSCSM
jgi:hypothetical protein